MPSITTALRELNRNEYLTCKHKHRPPGTDHLLLNGQPWCWDCVKSYLEEARAAGITVEVVRRPVIRRSL